MPTADDLLNNFDELDDRPTLNPFKSEPIAAPKKKKKAKKNAVGKLRYDEEETTPYPRSVTPSPPTSNGVLLEQSPPPLQLRCEDVALPIANFADDTTAVEESDSPPEPRPVASPTVRSPRRDLATLANPSTSIPAVSRLPHQEPSHRRQSPQSPPLTNVQLHRESFSTKQLPHQRFTDPPPPHMPQDHFFGTPHLAYSNEKFAPTARVAGSDGFCCRLDTFSHAGDLASAKRAKDVVLVGWDCGLDVYRQLSDKLEVVGRLEGLRGAVSDAKILPHTDRTDELQKLRPLVAVVVHGPSKQDPRIEDHERSGSTMPAGRLFQTSIEIYSLATQQHLATLYNGMPREPPVFGRGPAVSLATSAEDLCVDANGNYITVASGKSGEILLFSNVNTNGEQVDYRCIGKLWTAIQIRPERATSRPNTAHDGMVGNEEPRKRSLPLFSLGSRWLAITPPSSSHTVSVQGTPLKSSEASTPPGLASHSPPPQPNITCETAGVAAEGVITKFTRQATQSLWKASQVGLELGMQGWRDFTNQSPPANAVHNRTGSRGSDLFPPTNAPKDDSARAARDPTIVSVFDLQALVVAEASGVKQAPLPLATFTVPDGCNFLSFSPDGLRMLTANHSGELFRVWDLTHAVHGDMENERESMNEVRKGPYVRQIQRFVRNSACVLVDCAWTRDGDWAALTTANGTTHIHRIVPQAPSQRQRRSTITAPPSEKAEATVGVSQGLSPPSSNGFLGNLRSSWQTVTTQVNTITSQNTAAAFGLPTTFAGFKETAAAARSASGRAVARGLSQGYTAAKGGASDLWYADENKIKTRYMARFARPGCGKWIYRRSGHFIALEAGGTVHVIPVQEIERRHGDIMVKGLKHDRHNVKSFAMPPISTAGVSTDVHPPDHCIEQGPHGFWSLRLQEQVRPGTATYNDYVTAAEANEVETNPPYCPFHVDRRIGIFAYEDGFQDQLFKGYGNEDEGAWVFGEALPPSTKINERSQSESDDYEQGIDDEEFDGMAQAVESKLTVRSASGNAGGGGGKGDQIRIHTKRKPKSRQNTGGGEVERPQAVEGDFELVEDDDDDIMF